MECLKKRLQQANTDLKTVEGAREAEVDLLNGQCEKLKTHIKNLELQQVP